MEQKETKEKWRERSLRFKYLTLDLLEITSDSTLLIKSKVTSKMMTVKELNSKIQAVEYWDSDNNPLLGSKEEFSGSSVERMYTPG